MTYLVDTNVIRELVRNNPTVVAHADSARQVGDDIVYSVISKGEIHWGLERLLQSKRRIALTQGTNLILALMGTPVPIDDVVAERFGEVKAALEQKGQRIPNNDIWIAAIALTYGYTLVTADTHFDYVDGLQKVNWLLP